MELSFINASGVNIAYVEKNPAATKTIFFIHGNSGSSSLWHKQFADPAFNDYRLIAFDLPAHGNSSPLEDADNYNLLFLGKLMAQAVAGLKSEQNILAGISYGANVAAEMLNYLPVLTGIVLTSPTIVGGKYTLNDTLKAGADPSILFTDDPTHEAVIEYVHSTLSSQYQKDVSICLEDFTAVKKPFRSAILKTAMEGKLSDEIINLVTTNIPLFVSFGKQDSLVNADYLDDANLTLWNNTIHKINNAGHFLILDQPQIFNNLLVSYSMEMFK